jgi:hypothetical protein
MMIYENRASWTRVACFLCILRFALHLILSTLNPKAYTLHPAPYTLNPTPYTLHPKP